MAKKIFMVTTETSGDLLGGRMVTSLKSMLPDLELSGVGGEKLIEEGMETLYHVRDFNLMGLFEVLAQLPRMKRIFNHLVKEVAARKPDLVLLVDAPDFNLRFAKALRPLGIPIVYYVSPQVWAWRRGRARSIARIVDHMLVLFKFEVEFYKNMGLELDTTWVGHPLVDELKDMGDRNAFFADQGFDVQKPLVALAPGSRSSEVTRLLPVMTEIARVRADRFQFGVPLAGTIDEQLVREIVGDAPIKILPGRMRPLMAHADAAIVASGTATLETALLKTPMIVGYRLAKMTYFMARHLVKIPHVALVNIVLNERVAPEMIQHDFAPEKILPQLDELIAGGSVRQKQLDAFDRLTDILGGGGASEKAASVIRGYLEA